ncbi:hypothetical protein D3C73_1161990 [compost metagenome]
MHHAPSVDKHDGGQQHPACVEDVVVGEEVDVDRASDEGRDPPPRVSVESEVEQPENTHHVGTHSGIHKTAEQRDGPDPQDTFRLVCPGPHVRLEQLHRCPHHMEQQDHPEFPEGLEPEADHQNLDHNRGDGQEVVPCEARVVRVPKPGSDDYREQSRSEHTCPGLLQPEHHKLGEPFPEPSPAGAVQVSVGGVVDGLLNGGEVTHCGKPCLA